MTWGAVAVGAAGMIVGAVGGNSSDQSSGGNVTIYNKKLDTYTQGFTGTAPWSFATLDPTATLAAMGSGTSVNGKDLGAGTKQQLVGLSEDEKQQRTDTNAALARIKQRQESGQFLTPQETDFINTSLDKAFEYANTTGMRDITLQAQSLAGRQGLRTSDTPIAQPTMQATRDLALGIGSQRAQLGLNATMSMSAQQQAFDQSFAQFNQTLAMNKTNARMGFLFGGGMTGVGGITNSQAFSGNAQQNPSMMSTIGTTMDLAGRFGSMLNQPSTKPSVPASVGGGGFGGGGGGGASNYSQFTANNYGLG